MAEIIKIAELTINPEKLLKEMEATKQSIDKMTESQKGLKQAGDTSSKTFIQNEANLKTLKGEYNAQIKTLQAVSGVTQTLTNEMKKEVKSLAEAEANNKSLRKSRANLNLTTEEGQKALKGINKKIDENTTFMKTNQDAQVKLKMNVGNYGSTILGTLKNTKAYTLGMQAMAIGQGVLNMVVGKSTGVMKLFRIALASTGIGLIVIALGALITYFTSTQDGADKLARVMTPLKEVFGSLVGVVQQLGKALTTLFSGGGIKAFLGDVKEIGGNLGKTMRDAVERGKEIAALQQNLNKTNADYITQQAKLKKEFKEQKKISDDTTLTLKEREEAARKAISAQEQIRKGAVVRLEQEAKLLELKQQANDTSDEEKAQLATKLAEIDKALEEEAGKSTLAQNKLNSIIKEGYAKQKAAREKALSDKISSMEQELEYYEESQRLKLNTDEAQLENIKVVGDKEIAILKTKLDNKLITQREYETAKIALANEIKEKEDEIKATELDRIQNFEDKKRALEEELLLAKEEDDIARAELKAELDFEKKLLELEAMQLHEDEKTELLRLAEENRDVILNGIKKKFQDDYLKAFEGTMKAENAIRLDNAKQAVAITTKLTGMLSGLLGDSLAAKIAAIAIDAAIEVAGVQISARSAQATNLAAATAVGFPQNIPLIAGALTQNGILEGQATASTIAILGNAALAGVGAGIQSIKKPSEPKFGLGGVLSGASHANGGIQTPYGEVEGGEAVINKKSTAMYGGLLSQINQAGGGVKFGDSGRLGEAGVSGSMTLIDYDLLSAKIAIANMSLPNPVVSVSEINDTNNRVSVIEQKANF